MRQGKGNKSRLLPVGGRAAIWLDRYLAESRPLFVWLPGGSALFPSPEPPTNDPPDSSQPPDSGGGPQNPRGPEDSPCGGSAKMLGIPTAMQATAFQPCPMPLTVPTPPGGEEISADLVMGNDAVDRWDYLGYVAANEKAMIGTVHSGAMKAHRAAETEREEWLELGENVTP